MAAVLPAPAGMVPSRTTRPASWSSAPRTRGDGPIRTRAASAPSVCSPHPRGWSRLARDRRKSCPVLPAPAGMVPAPAAPVRARPGAPRTRGDGPCSYVIRPPSGMCSPHPRGWSHHSRSGARNRRVLPAPAGMVPLRMERQAVLTRAPRTRGDGPAAAVRQTMTPPCSPHPRGWSRYGQQHPPHRVVLPALAGMVPTMPLARRHVLGLPAPAGWSHVAGPHRADAHVLPAPAGTVGRPADPCSSHRVAHFLGRDLDDADPLLVARRGYVEVRARPVPARALRGFTSHTLRAGSCLHSSEPLRRLALRRPPPRLVHRVRPICGQVPGAEISLRGRRYSPPSACCRACSAARISFGLPRYSARLQAATSSFRT